MTSLRFSTDSGAAVRSGAGGGAFLPSARERISHVVRRLGIGANAPAAIEAASVDDAIAAAIDLTPEPTPMPPFPAPANLETARNGPDIQIPLSHWLEQMVSSPRRIEERLVWFWHDHFATSLRKVKIPFLFWQQHATVRSHATGRFDELLRAIARDPAMLHYLDGRSNRAGAINENFAREVMELHTMGRGNYTQEDVVAAARAFSGWVVAPGAEDRRRQQFDVSPWTAVFVPFRHDASNKALLGVSGSLDMDDALDIILDQPSTAQTVAAKLYTELVGTPPPPPTAERLGNVFRTRWRVMDLVEEVVSDPLFVSDEVVRSRIRTPIERLVGIAQGMETAPQVARIAVGILDRLGFVPFVPPNPAGFPSGHRLLGPYQLTHWLDVAGMISDPPPDYPIDDVFTRLGIFDVSESTRSVVAAAPDALTRITLAAASPEYALT